MYSAEIVNELGGYARLASRLGLSRTAVFNWQKAGIPPQRCKQVEALAKELGLDKPFTGTDGKKHPGLTLVVLMNATPGFAPPKPRTAVRKVVAGA